MAFTRAAKRQKIKEEEEEEEDAVKGRTWLVLYLTCCRHPYLFLDLRLQCKAHREDSEMEIEYIKFKKNYGQPEYMLKRLSLFLTSLPPEVVCRHVLEYIFRAFPRTYHSHESYLAYKLSPFIQTMMARNRMTQWAHNLNLSMENKSLAECMWAFIEACGGGFIDIVRFMLLIPGIDPSYDNNRALHSAMGSNRTEVVHLLLSETRVDPSSRDNALLCKALGVGNVELAREILSHPRFRTAPKVDELLKLLTI